MAREVFRHRSSKAATRKLTVSTDKVAHRVLANPDDYIVIVRNAVLIEPRHDGNISVALELADPESGKYFYVRPLWVDGPNAGRGNMAAHNLGIIADLLEVIGIPPTSYKELNDELLARLIGRSFNITLDIDRGNRGGVFNVVVRVNGGVDPAGAMPIPDPSATG
jgi:hypothetical protein